MALNLQNKYPGRFDPVSADYPQGKFKNRSSPTAQDGSYMESDWLNDWAGFFGAILTGAGVTPNGNVDTATSSQYFSALIQYLRSTLFEASETARGVLRIATDSETVSGTDDSLAITPKKMKRGLSFAGSGATFGFRLPAWLGSYTFNVGSSAPVSGGAVTITFPIGYQDLNYSVFFGARESGDPTGAQSHVIDESSRTNGSFRVKQFTITAGSVSPSSSAFFWMAVGKSV